MSFNSFPINNCVRLVSYFKQEIKTRSLKRLMHTLFPVQASLKTIVSTIVSGLYHILVKHASCLKIHCTSNIITLKIYKIFLTHYGLLLNKRFYIYQ